MCGFPASHLRRFKSRSHMEKHLHGDRPILSGRTYMANENREIHISEATARKLLSARDARACMLWLRLSCFGGDAGRDGDGKLIAAELGWSEAEFRAAVAQLESLGMLPSAPLEPAEEPPHYTAADISETLERDAAFAETLRYTQTRLGRTLTTTDVGRLLSVYQNAGLPAGALMLLVSYCDNRAKRRSGETARVTMYMIEKEAYRWARDGVTTESEAEAHVRQLEQREERSARLARMFQITGRSLTATERAYIDRWIELPLDDDTIYAAYDRTVVNTGSLKWRYMNKILEDWAAHGRPAEETQEGAQRRSDRNPERSGQDAGTRAPTPSPRRSDSERLRRLREIEEGKHK